MKNEYQVVSPELAQEMKELGVKQDSVWYWTWAQWNEEVEWVLIQQDKIPRLKKEYFSAYSVAELGEMLPGEISEKIGNMTANPYFLDCGKIDSEHSYYVRYIRHATGDTFCIMRGSKEANIRAKMLIHLIKEGVIKVEDIK